MILGLDRPRRVPRAGAAPTLSRLSLRADDRALGGVLVLATLAGWLGIVGALTLAQSDDLVAALRAAPGNLVAPSLLIFIAAVLFAEQRWPAVPQRLFARAHLVDASYLALFALIVGPLLICVDTGASTEIARHAHFLMIGRLPVVPRAIVVLAILIGIDAMNWAGHVANHRVRTLWRLHALHHSQEEMSVLTTFRTHPLVHAAYLPSLLPALVLSASGSVPSLALVGYSVLVTLPHANLRWRFGPLGAIFVSPAYHRIHHMREISDGRATVNFGFVLVLWDALAHVAVQPEAGVFCTTGIAGRPVPVEQSVTGSAVIGVVLRQLVQPFRRTPSGVR